MNLYKKFLQSCLDASIPAIGINSAAAIMAVLYVYGGEDEWFTHNQKFKEDCWYIRNRWKIDGGSIPESDFREKFQSCVRELEGGMETPQRYKSLFKQRYNYDLRIFTSKL